MGKYKENYLLVTGLILVTISMVSLTGLRVIKNEEKSKTGSALSVVLQTSHEAISRWYEEKSTDVETYASLPFVNENSVRLLKILNSKGNLIKSAVLKELRRELNPIITGSGNIGFFIIAPDYTNIASMRDSNIGKKNLLGISAPYLDRIFDGQTLITPPLRSDVPLPDKKGVLKEGMFSMFAGTPIYGEDGAIIAALTIRMDPEGDFSRITQLGRIGETGETYAFDNMGRLLTKSRFMDHLNETGLLKPGENEIMNITIRDPGVDLTRGEKSHTAREDQPFTLMAGNAISGKKGSNFEGYRDYRGVTVIGAWLWDKELGFGLTTEIDASEAYHAYYIIRSILISIIALITLIYAALSLAIMGSRKKALILSKELQITNDKLQNEKSHIETLISNIPGAVYRCANDEEWTVEIFSDEIFNISGYESSEFLRNLRSYSSIIHKNDVDYVNQTVEEAINNKSYFNIEYRIISSSGDIKWVFERGKGIFNKDGDLLHLEGIIFDITKHKMSEIMEKESSRLLELFFKDSHTSFVLLDIDFNFIRVNEAYAKSCGYPVDFFPGKNHFELYPSPLEDKFKEVRDSGKAFSIQSRAFSFPDHPEWGTTYWDLDLDPIKNERGEIELFVFSLTDVTDKTKNELALKESQDQINLLLNSTAEAIYGIDLEGNCTFANAACARVLGYDESGELIGKNIHNLIHHSRSDGSPYPEKDCLIFKSFIEKKGTHVDNEVLWRKDGSSFPSEYWSYPISKNGELCGSVVTFLDITERIESERKIKEFKTLADRMSDAIFTFHPDTLIFNYVNETARKQLDYSDDELIKMTPLDIKPEYDEESFKAILLPLIKEPEKAVNFETVHRHKNGSLIPVEIALQYFAPEGETPRFTAIVRDISERRGKDAMLRLAKEDAEKANKAKSTFLAAMSHEIRTPLNSVLGLTEVLMESRLDGEQRRLMQVVQSAGDALLHLINDILDLSRIESGSMQLDYNPVILADEIEKAVSIVLYRAKEKGVEIEWSIHDDVPDAFYGDAVRIRQILINLINNAVKFTEKGSVTIGVKGSTVEGGREELLISVRDTGIGISSDKKGIIFEPFRQSDSYITRNYGGTGLGLTIVRKLLELMDGRIWVESEAGKGSTFYFTVKLPVLEREDKAGLLNNIRVLVFGEENSERKRICNTLLEEGAVIEEAGDSRDALKILESSTDKPINMVVGRCDAEIDSGCIFGEKVRAMKNIVQPAILLAVEGMICRKIERGISSGIRCGMLEPLQKKELLREALDAMAEAGKISHPPDDKSKSIDILLVDDAKDNRMLITTFLKKTPHRVISAENGLEAIEAFEKQSFDLVLMDVQMPVMDGYSATKKIRKLEKENSKKRTPILAFTAHAFKEDEVKSREAGCDGHLTKPIKKAKLLEVVKSYSCY